jgi:hypothetical protein
MSYDIACVGNERTGKIVIHTATCPVARQAAADGHPVMTMFGCERIPDYERHDCLKLS